MTRPRLPSLLLLALFGLVIIRRAWVSDDAYITFRTVDNFLHGYGLVWNVGERVQAYTHPLWMFLITGVAAITREFHFTSLALSVGISLAAVILFARRLPSGQTAVLFGLLCLTLSKAFVDYSTSGLENPLAHLLIIICAIQILDSRSLIMPQASRFENRRLISPAPVLLSLSVSLLLLTRLDLALLVAPACLLRLWERHSKHDLRGYILGALPLLVWEAFSLFYYGFPFPNTFYAKLSTGIPQAELTAQGFQYLLNALEFDPLTLLLIAAGLAAALALRDRRSLALAAGNALYLVYVVRIGGDFMAGRFLTSPLLISVILITRLDFESLPALQIALAFALPLVLALGAPNNPLDFRDTATLQTPSEHVDHRGISDERLNYAPFTALLALPRDALPPTHVWAWQGTRDAGKGHSLITKFGIGFYGFNAGPGVHIIDQLALADPLLARLPAARDLQWRIGHFIRIIPKGYENTLAAGKNLLRDEDLAFYYDKLSLITRGPLWSKTRLWEIIRMNFGAYADLIAWDAYRYPEMVSTTLAGVLTPESGAPLVLGDSGIVITLGAASHTTGIEVSLGSAGAYEIVYTLGGVRVASQDLPAVEYPEGGLALHRVRVPPEAAAQGFDQIFIFPTYGENFSLGHLLLDEAGQ